MTQSRNEQHVPLARRDPATDRILPGELHLLLLEQYAAPSLVVTGEHVVVHVSATAGRFLRVPSGEPSHDVMRLIVPPLRAALRAALQLAAQARSPAAAGPVRLSDSNHSAIRIVVKPATREGDPRQALFLVLFEQEPDAVRLTEGEAPAVTAQQRPRLDELGDVTAELAADNRDVDASILSAQRETASAMREFSVRLETDVKERTGQPQAEMRDPAGATAQLTVLLQKMVTAQEAQRARIARDLHDQLGQQLTALRLALERHRDRCAGPADDLETGLRLVRQLDDQIDFLAWELRPAELDDLGLTLALPRFVEEWSSHYGVVAHFTARGPIAGQLKAEAETAFYRIAQEALNNVVKHAHASRVDVLLERRDGAIVLVVEDDGLGFDPADTATVEKGLGLIGMRERALLVGGTLDVESSPGGGATVYFRCPVAAGRQSPA